MTAFGKISKNQKRNSFNQKDGRLGQPELNPLDWEAAGFVRTGWNSRSYTWEGNSPTFSLKPAIVVTDDGADEGLLAQHDQSGTRILFAYWAQPVDIKARLDCEIFEIMQHDADLAEAPIDWSEWSEMVRDF